MHVVIPDQASERRHANIVNVTKRHCRIGQVRWKPPKGIKYWYDAKGQRIPEKLALDTYYASGSLREA